MSVPRVSELGEGWENDRAVFEEEGIQSLVVVPIVIENQLEGFIGFDSVRRQRNWLDEEVRLLGVSSDLMGSALKRVDVERQLHDSQRHLKRTERLARVGSWEWHIPDNSFHISEIFLNLLGCEDTTLGREELLQKYVHPDDLPEAQRRMKEAGETGKPYHYTYRIIRGDTGEIRWVDSQARYQYADGKPVLVQGFMQDITERKLADQALIEGEKRYRSLVNGLRDVVFEVDVDGRWRFLNPAWEQITGFSVAETLGKCAFDLVHPDDKALNRNQTDALVRGDQEFSRYEIRFLPRNGSLGWAEVQIQRLQDEQGNYAGLSGTCRNITLQRQAEEKLVHMAQYDELTGLPNRWLAMDRLKQSLLAAQRRNESLAVLFVDIDQFKKVNDTLGHDTGDELLIAAAQRLTKLIRQQDTVARLGGDEFLIIMNGIHQYMDVQPVLEKLLNGFHQPFEVQGRMLVQTASIGVAIAPHDGESPDILLRNADMAMYRSKAAGRDTYHFFTDSMSREMDNRVAIEEALHSALDNKELYPVFQPLVDIASGQIAGAEILLRWHSATLGSVPPVDFISVAEQTGMIDPIGNFVMEQAVLHAIEWHKILGESFYISVNVSPRQFRDPAMPNRLLALCERHALPASAVVVEVTEGVLLSNQRQALKAMEVLRKAGVRMAMDDFGTGYASLSYLREYPFDMLKIDRSFVAESSRDTKDAELVTASVRLAAGLGLKAIAEGVETPEQLAFLRAQGCPLAQGYLFSPPLKAEEMTKLVASGLSTELFSTDS